MKILMLGWELPPHNSGGLGVACYQMCRHLALKNVRIEFVLPYTPPPEVHAAAHFMKIHGASPIAPKESSVTGGVYDSPGYSRESGLARQQHGMAEYASELALQNSYDAIHAHEWLTFQAGIRAKERSGTPLIAHIHATEFDRSGEFGGNPAVHEIEYNGLVAADRIIAVSDITKQIIVREYGIPENKIQVAHNSLDHSALPPLEAENTYRYLTRMKRLGYKVVVSLGRLTTQKGLPYLLKAAQAVVQRNPKVLFLIAGDGELKHELLMQSAELGIAQNIIFTGFVRGKQWRDAYDIGDIFVMSSVSEPFGLSALEAAAHSNAILLTKQSGVGEVLQNVIRYDFWDTQKLADAILNIASHDALRQELAINAQRECNQLSWHSTADICRALYQQVTATGATA